MNVTLIPFFLAANVVVNDTSKWTFGPEYLYDLNITTVIKLKHNFIIKTFQWISTITCRPKFPDNLFCHLNDFTLLQDSYKNFNKTDKIRAGQMFKIKFNERGVEELMVNEPVTFTNILQKFASHLNVVDRHKINISQFVELENSTLGDYATMYNITRKERKLETNTNCQLLKEGDTDFRLVILPLADARPGTTLSIEKCRFECLNSPKFVTKDMRLEMERFVSKIQINSKKFETFTEIHGKTKPATDKTFIILSSFKDALNFYYNVSFKELIQINLNSIRPAQNELPDELCRGKRIDLYHDMVPSYFVDD